MDDTEHKCKSKFNLRTKILTVTLPIQADDKDASVIMLRNKIWVGSTCMNSDN